MHRRLLDLTRGAPVPLLLTVASGLLAGWLTIAQSYALSATIDGVFLRRQALDWLQPWMTVLLAVAIGRALMVWLNEAAASRVAVRIKSDLRARLFEHILALGPAYTRGERAGELTAAAVDGIEALDAYFSQYLPQLVISTLVPLSVLALVFPLDPLSGVVLLVTAPLIPFFMYMIGRGAEAASRQQYETLSRLSAHFLDSLQGLTTLKLFGQSKAQARNIAAVSDQYRDTTLRVLQVTFLSAFALELLATISTAIVAVEVGLRLLYGRMEFQQALFLLILAPEFYLPLRMLGLRFHAGMAGTSAARRIFQVLELPAARALAETAGAEPLQPVSEIDLAGISYTYPDEAEPAVRDISLTVRSGQHIAIVGPSGAGKSTLASLLLGFFSPSSGSLHIDGRPLADAEISRWRSLIAWVPQDPHLFHGTLGDNLRLGRPNATDAQLEAAVRAAHLDDFVRSLAQGYETQIGEGGARLSSGQAQRVALARAFLKDAPILVMDEPTSSLDPETEALLEESTRELMRGRTVFTIAHRINTVARADRILVMQRGRIMEDGTHKELLDASGEYAALLQARLSRMDAAPSQVASPSPAALVASAGRWAADSGAQLWAGSRGPVLRRLLGFLRGSWSWVALAVILGTLTVGSSVALMGTSSWLISTAALHPSIAALEVAIVGVRFFGISRAVFRYLERLVSHNVTFRLLGRLRVWFYERLEPLAPAGLMQYRSGDLLARVIGDVGTLEDFYVRVIAPPATAILVLAGTVAFLQAVDGRVALLLVVNFAALGILLPFAIQHLGRTGGTQVVQQRAELQGQLVDGVQGLPEIVAYGRGSQHLARLRATGEAYGRAQLHVADVRAWQAAAYAFFTALSPWLILQVAAPAVLAGHVSGVMLAPLVLLSAASFEAVAPLPQAAQTWSSVRAAAARLFDLVDARPQVHEDALGASVSTPLPLIAANAEFSHVSFAYPGETIPVLEDVSLRLERGRKIAIVGPSGAGKSTLGSLLLRFWDYQQGEICLGGRRLRELSPDAVRQQVGFLSPHTYLFNTTVFENLRMARRGVSRLEAERAAQAAQIHETIVKLPKGYDTPIGERGVRLSGGERQRLAIARLILKDAPILLLDEPTANLDPLTEIQVLQSLFALMHDRAALLITHRLVGLENMDEILFLERGRIVERGAHGRLLEAGGPYRRFWDLQNRFLPVN